MWNRASREVSLGEMYDDCLNEIYETVKLGNLEVEPADIIREFDETAYRCGFNDWMDGEDFDCVDCGKRLDEDFKFMADQNTVPRCPNGCHDGWESGFEEGEIVRAVNTGHMNIDGYLVEILDIDCPDSPEDIYFHVKVNDDTNLYLTLDQVQELEPEDYNTEFQVGDKVRLIECGDGYADITGKIGQVESIVLPENKDDRSYIVKVEDQRYECFNFWLERVEE